MQNKSAECVPCHGLRVPENWIKPRQGAAIEKLKRSVSTIAHRRFLFSDSTDFGVLSVERNLERSESYCIFPRECGLFKTTSKPSFTAQPPKD